MSNRERIVAAVAGGLTFSQAADRFGVSRSAVAGMVYRSKHPHQKLSLGEHNLCRGERQPTAKLTDDAVRDIRAKRPGVPLKVLAAQYGVNTSIISRVAKMQNWKHVT